MLRFCSVKIQVFTPHFQNDTAEQILVAWWFYSNTARSQLLHPPPPLSFCPSSCMCPSGQAVLGQSAVVGMCKVAALGAIRMVHIISPERFNSLSVPYYCPCRAAEFYFCKLLYTTFTIAMFMMVF